MAIILFVLLKIKRGYILITSNPKYILYNVLFLLLVFALIYGFAQYVTSMNYNIGVIKMMIFSLICIISFFKNFIPYYKPIINIVPEYYPMSRYQAVLLNILNDLTSIYYLYILVFLFFFKSCSTILDFTDLLFCILLLLNTNIATRIFRIILEYKITITIFNLTKTLLVALILIYLLNISFSSPSIYALIVLCLLLWINFNLESLGGKQNNTSCGSTVPLILLSINNTAFRSSFLLYLIIKIIFLIGSLIGIYIDHLPQNMLLIWIVLSPLILFSFIFNNLWGYFKNVWLNIFIRNNKFKEFILFYLKILFIPITIDFLIMFLYSLLAEHDVILSIKIYLSITSIFISIGILSSMYYPKMVTRKILFKQDSSKIVSILEILYICLVVKFEIYIVEILIVSFMSAFIVYFYINRIRISLSNRIYEELYR